MCIYYTDRSNLTYSGTEHIIPAAWGGILKLPKGYVSDEFNNDMSRLEQEVIRDTVVAAPRVLQGPGKRGNLSPELATKSKVLIYETGIPQRPVLMGYIQGQKTTQITHFHYDTSTLQGGIAVDCLDKDLAVMMAKEFQNRCAEPARLRKKMILDDRIPEKFVMFGIDDNVEENFNAFIAKNPANEFDFNDSKIQQLSSYRYNTENLRDGGTHQMKYVQTYKFDYWHPRIYGKIAFNYLAHLVGADFVRQQPFDGFRNWIAKGWDGFYGDYDLKGQDFFKTNNLNVPESSHYILIQTVNNTIVAKVCIYMLRFEFILGRNYPDEIPIQGLICDWKNRKEYSLYDYLKTTQQLQ